jgi:hypothetical protein
MEITKMRIGSYFAALIFVIILAIGGGLTFAMYRDTVNMAIVSMGVITLVFALIVSKSISGCRPMGKGGGLAIRQVPLSQGTGIVFHYPDHRRNTLLD